MDVNYWHYLLLGLIQGITEFLPISSSAHLILLPHLLDWPDQGLAVDVAAHVGTLLAVCGYFRHDLIRLLIAGHRGGFRPQNPDARLLWYLLVATLPVAIVGLVSADFIATSLRSPLVIASGTVIFALVLGWSDRYGAGRRGTDSLAWRDVLIIGAAQALALIPGTSRSGITITAGLMLGLDRESASRFAFLLSIPVTALAGLYEGMKLMRATVVVDWAGVLLVTVVSALTAALTIHLFLRFIQRTGMWPYVAYRLLLGGVLFWFFL